MNPMRPGKRKNWMIPIRTVEELFACKPAMTLPRPGKGRMLRIKHSKPVALGTLGTFCVVTSVTKSLHSGILSD